jgi:hypothetical protein
VRGAGDPLDRHDAKGDIRQHHLHRLVAKKARVVLSVFGVQIAEAMAAWIGPDVADARDGHLADRRDVVVVICTGLQISEHQGVDFRHLKTGQAGEQRIDPEDFLEHQLQFELVETAALGDLVQGQPQTQDFGRGEMVDTNNPDHLTAKALECFPNKMPIDQPAVAVHWQRRDVIVTLDKSGQRFELPFAVLAKLALGRFDAVDCDLDHPL